MNAAKERTSFFVANNWTHIHLLNGRHGVVVDSHNGQVTMQDNTGRQEIFDQERLHLTWAPLSSDSQGEQA